MSTIWVICGAGRGVGKTALAERLCAVLPDSLYAKCGHGPFKAGKPANYFSTTAALEEFVASQGAAGHIVVESNAWARAGRGDIVAFVDGVRGRTGLREDAADLRSRAHLHVAADASRADWLKVLKKSLSSEALCRAVCDALAAQQTCLFGAQPKVRTKVWLESAGARVFGNGLALLLEHVDVLGTLQGAAQAAGMSYRYAWNLIRSAERRLGRDLVLRRSGGAHGGSSVLSEEGRSMLNLFRRLNSDVAAYADKRFSEFCNREGRHARAT